MTTFFGGMTMKIGTALASAAIITLAMTSVAHAHHSSSTYDVEQSVSIEGAVTRVLWVNPHVFIYIDQTTEDGVVRNWAVEGVNPAGLRRVGWSRDTLELGDIISVSGNPSKNMTSPGIYPQSITHAGIKLFDEQEFFAGVFAVEEAAVGTSSLVGVWKNPLTPAVIIPREAIMDYQPGVGLHEVTQAGLEALTQFDELTMNPAINCVEVSAPLIMHFGDNKQLFIENDVIRIISEYDGGERVIHLGIDTHDGAEYSNQGHSIGKLEGNTLEIDTTHFSKNNFGNGFGIPSSPQKHLFERLTLSDDGKSISYHFSLTDPIYLSAPMSLDTSWAYQPDGEVVVDECNIESARRFLEN
ncbi:MAG: hypothetical protein COB20_04070 [SAR86 cluster bacterium]|uniref:Uncharacterized protein n=1 Tax=SAR86 cluster bacterium TaxID=2030880 RepID=A0A2A4XC90_9GAMM|nr:MAG: hypothetical protein COB20_04070 [SAR86 cluster bacterium]